MKLTPAIMAAGMLVASLLSPLRGRAASGDAAPVRAGGALTLANWQFPTSTALGGSFSNTDADATVDTAVAPGIVGYDTQGNYLPILATELPSASNGGIVTLGIQEVMTVHLRPGLRWSDGSPITTADFSLAYSLPYAPQINGGTLATDAIASILFRGDDMVITFKQPITDPLSVLTRNPLPAEYLSAKYGIRWPDPLISSYDVARVAAYYASPDYTASGIAGVIAGKYLTDRYIAPNDIYDGPYRISEYSSGQHVTLVPNSYWNGPAAGMQTARLVVQSLGSNEQGLLQALGTDATYAAVDQAEGLAFNAIPALTASKYTVAAPSARAIEFLQLNLANPELADVRVRQALLYALNKIAYLYALFPAAYGPDIMRMRTTVPYPLTSSWNDQKSYPNNSYNPAMARALLAAAGYTTTLTAPGRHVTLDFWTTPSATRIRSAQVLQHLFARLGVQLRIHYAPSDGPGSMFGTYSESGILSNRRYDIAEIAYKVPADPGWIAGSFDPRKIPDATHPLDANYGGVNDPQLYHLLQNGASTQDPAARQDIYNQVQQRIVRQAYWIVLYTRLDPVAVKNGSGVGNPWQQDRVGLE